MSKQEYRARLKALIKLGIPRATAILMLAALGAEVGDDAPSYDPSDDVFAVSLTSSGPTYDVRQDTILGDEIVVERPKGPSKTNPSSGQVW